MLKIQLAFWPLYFVLGGWPGSGGGGYALVPPMISTLPLASWTWPEQKTSAGVTSDFHSFVTGS